MFFFLLHFCDLLRVCVCKRAKSIGIHYNISQLRTNAELIKKIMLTIDAYVRRTCDITMGQNLVYQRKSTLYLIIRLQQTFLSCSNSSRRLLRHLVAAFRFCSRRRSFLSVKVVLPFNYNTADQCNAVNYSVRTSPKLQWAFSRNRT